MLRTGTSVVNNVAATHNAANGLVVLGDGTLTNLTVDRGFYSYNGEDGIQIRNIGDITLRGVWGFGNTDNGVDINSPNSTVDQSWLWFWFNWGGNIVIVT